MDLNDIKLEALKKNIKMKQLFEKLPKSYQFYYREIKKGNLKVINEVKQVLKEL